jgi:hypothetical protein
VGLGFKLLCLSVGFAILVGQVTRSTALMRHAARAGAVLLALLLLFPHLVMVWSPKAAAEANWLHLQHKSLTWFGGDVFGLQEIKDFAWKSHVYAADLLDQATGMNAPAFRPNVVPFGSLSDLFAWFGYSNTFCQFVGSGWGLSLLGAILLFFESYRHGKRADAQGFRAAARTGAAVLATGVLVGSASAALSGLELDRARDAAERGLFSVALDRIDLVTDAFPVLAESSDLALQRGVLEARLGRETPEATLYRARVLQGQGLLEEAEALFGSLLQSDAAGGVRREALRGILRRGIRELNSGETIRAMKSLEMVLGADPCNLKANYALELAYLRAARFESLRDLAARMRATYRFFGDETKLPVLAAAQENVAYAAYLQNDPTLAHALWHTLGDPKRLTER